MITRIITKLNTLYFPNLLKDNNFNRKVFFLSELLHDKIYHLIELPLDWLIDDAMFVCLLDDLILSFLLQQFDTGNRWIWNRIDYYPSITSEPTNQVPKHCL